MIPIIGPIKPLESIHFDEKTTYEKLCKHHEFEQWKGTCDNHGMIIRRLDNNGLGRVAPNWAQDNSEWNLIRNIRSTLIATDGETTIADL